MKSCRCPKCAKELSIDDKIGSIIKPIKCKECGAMLIESAKKSALFFLICLLISWPILDRLAPYLTDIFGYFIAFIVGLIICVLDVVFVPLVEVKKHKNMNTNKGKLSK